MENRRPDINEEGLWKFNTPIEIIIISIFLPFIIQKMMNTNIY